MYVTLCMPIVLVRGFGVSFCGLYCPNGIVFLPCRITWRLWTCIILCRKCWALFINFHSSVHSLLLLLLLLEEVREKMKLKGRIRGSKQSAHSYILTHIADLREDMLLYLWILRKRWESTGAGGASHLRPLYPTAAVPDGDVEENRSNRSEGLLTFAQLFPCRLHPPPPLLWRRRSPSSRVVHVHRPLSALNGSLRDFYQSPFLSKQFLCPERTW